MLKLTILIVRRIDFATATTFCSPTPLPKPAMSAYKLLSATSTGIPYTRMMSIVYPVPGDLADQLLSVEHDSFLKLFRNVSLYPGPPETYHPGCYVPAGVSEHGLFLCGV